jgi:hypothetical protein
MYEVLFDEGNTSEVAKIRLTKGKFKDIIYKYGAVRFLEDDGDDAILQFDYDIVETPGGLDTDNLSEQDQKDFENTLGDILTELITEAADYNENLTNDTDKSDLQRGLHKTSNSVSKD